MLVHVLKGFSDIGSNSRTRHHGGGVLDASGPSTRTSTYTTTRRWGFGRWRSRRMVSVRSRMHVAGRVGCFRRGIKAKPQPGHGFVIVQGCGSRLDEFQVSGSFRRTKAVGEFPQRKEHSKDELSLFGQLLFVFGGTHALDVSLCKESFALAIKDMEGMYRHCRCCWSSCVYIAVGVVVGVIVIVIAAIIPVQSLLSLLRCCENGETEGPILFTMVWDMVECCSASPLVFRFWAGTLIS